MTRPVAAPKPLAAPKPGEARTFWRYLAAAERRRRRAGGSSSAYALTVLACFYGPAVVIGAVSQLTGPATAHPWLAPVQAILLLGAALAAASAGWSLLGPIPASPARAAWVLSTPLDRAATLASRIWVRVPVALLTGFALGTLAAAATGARGFDVTLSVTISGSCAGLLPYAAAIRRQRAAHSRLWRPVLLAAVLVIAAAVSRAWFPAPPAALTTPGSHLWFWLSALPGMLGIALLVATPSWVRRIPSYRLVAAHGAANGIVLAFTELSLEPVGTATPAGRRTGTRSRPFAGTGRAALASLAWRRLWRSRVGLARFVIADAVFYPLALLGRGSAQWPPVLAVAGVIAASLAISGVAGTARQLQRSPHLAAYFGLDARVARRTALVIPGVLALMWAALVTPAMVLGGTAVGGPLAAMLGWALVVYRVTRPEFAPTYAFGQQYPVDLALRFARGPAQLAIACIIAALVATAF